MPPAAPEPSARGAASAGDIRRKVAAEARKRVEQREQAASERRSKLPEGLEKELASAGVAADESSTKAFGWKQAQQQTSPEGTSAAKADSAEDDFPTEEECALGVRRMISGSIYGMREGLELLGLPSEPLFFVRGKRLLLLGRDIRSAVNAIIDEWMMENKEEFRSRLKLLQGEIWDIEARLRLDDDFHQGQAEAYEDHSNPSDSGSSAFDIEEVTGGKAKAEDVPSQEALLASAELADGQDEPGEEPSRSRPDPKLVWTIPDFDYDLYEVLGISPDATQSEIRARFRAVVLTQHPDNGGDEEIFAKMQKAFGVLTHHGKRQTYDCLRRDQKEA